MNIYKTAVNRPVTTIMIMLIIVLLGTVSLSMLPTDMYPSMEIPVALVSIEYKGAGPEEIETLITETVEDALATVENMKSISSVSTEGSSMVIVEFEYGTDMDFATLEIREQVDFIEDFLPENASAPMVFKVNPDMMPVIMLNVSSNMELPELYKLVDDDIMPKLEKIEGVASANTIGGVEEEIKIDIDQEKLVGYGLSLSQIRGTIQNENINLPNGDINKGSKELIIRTMGEFESLDDIKNVPIILPNGEKILLSDIASVYTGYEEKKSMSKVNGEESIGIFIMKQSVGNTVTVCENVLTELETIKNEYPQINFTTAFDQSEFINKSISSVARSAVLGGILAVIVLYIFLRNIRSTIIIGIAIPTSVIATFALMYGGGLTLNVISLGGLALGVGMLVDNSIVVLENIYRLRENGYSRKDASIVGTKEVATAIFASTLTTVAVFLPMVFVDGITSILLKDMSFTVVFALTASLIIALTVVPMLCSKFLKVTITSHQHDIQKTKKYKFLHAFASVFEKLTKKYTSILKTSLKHRKLTVFIVLGIFILSLGLIGMVGGEFFPKTDEGTFSITAETPYGTSLEEMNNISIEIEEYVNTIPELEDYSVTIGNDSMFSQTGANSIDLQVNLVDRKLRKRSTEEVTHEARTALSKVVGVEMSVSESSTGMGGSSTPIEIKLQGDALETLKTISNDVKDIIKSVPGTVEVESNLEDGSPELKVKLNRKKASFYGITAYQLANTLDTSLEGKKTTTYKVNGDELDINISLNDTVTHSVDNMKQILIQSPTGQYVAVGQIADFEFGNSPTEINRSDQVRTVTIGANIYGRDLQSITKDITEKLDSYNIPSGYSYTSGGQQKDMAESFVSLFLALILSIILIYMILAAQFESFIQPIIVMMSVPFALTGAFLALFITQTPLSMPAFIGLIMLAGIVVNNAIVIVDFINQQRSKFDNLKDAVIFSGKARIRPIFMTMLTTVLGLLPIAIGIGEGSETQAPMGITVIGGLLFSTIITLVFVPVTYTLFDDLVNKVKNKLSRKKKTLEEAR